MNHEFLNTILFLVPLGLALFCFWCNKRETFWQAQNLLCFPALHFNQLVGLFGLFFLFFCKTLEEDKTKTNRSWLTVSVSKALPSDEGAIRAFAADLAGICQGVTNTWSFSASTFYSFCLTARFFRFKLGKVFSNNNWRTCPRTRPPHTPSQLSSWSFPVAFDVCPIRGSVCEEVLPNDNFL